MKVGIVGSRRRKDKDKVFQLVDSLKLTDVVVSGGCEGVDSWAEDRAKERGMKVMILKPNLKDISHKGDMVNRYYERNKKIVQNSDIIYAFVSSERTGGTENTIKWAKELGIEIRIF